MIIFPIYIIVAEIDKLRKELDMLRQKKIQKVKFSANLCMFEEISDSDIQIGSKTVQFKGISTAIKLLTLVWQFLLNVWWLPSNFSFIV